MESAKPVLLLGYSGHAYVVCDALLSSGKKIAGYLEKESKNENPYGLDYFGSEEDNDVMKKITGMDYFVAVGDNSLRRKIADGMKKKMNAGAVNAVHARAVISSSAELADGILCAPVSIVNAKAVIGNGVILNTACVVEHECIVGDFAHIAPGAILCGNVRVGEGTFVGAGAVVREGIVIGKNSLIGAGTVVNRDVPDNVKVVGNPYRIIGVYELER
ncbi:MAG TPA: acetyltransferase [Bacteroidia bacterium]|nr:acetyltransferase [Bacteroidia bacterium]